MRVIHSFLKSPLRAFLSLYEYASECMTCSLAGRKHLLFGPL